MIKQLIISSLFFASLIALSSNAIAEKRGLHRDPLTAITTNGQTLKLYKESHALLIGIGDYKEGWSDLPSIPSELDQVQAALEKKGFNVTRVSNPNATELYQAFHAFVQEYGYEKESRLLFYFSGHGYSDKRKGYLVPADASLPDKNPQAFKRAVVDMDQVMAWARRIESKHALFLFDSCFSGSVFKARDFPRKQERYIRTITNKPVRQFITAGSAGETVPARSIFTPAFVEAIEDGAGDLNNDGYITGQELGVYLSQLVPNFSDQTPQYGKIGDYDLSRGDFVFFAGAGSQQTITPNTPANNEASKVEQTPPAITTKEQIFWETAKKKNKVSYYRLYAKNFPKGRHIELALWRVAELSDTLPAYQDYSKNYPEGSYTDLAKLEIERLTEQAKINAAPKPSKPTLAVPKPPASAATKPSANDINTVPTSTTENNKTQVTKKKSELWVKPFPKFSTIRFKGSSEKFQQGMNLPAGKVYTLEVSHPGFITRTQRIELKPGGNTISVELKQQTTSNQTTPSKKEATLKVATFPKNARVRILNIKPKYKDNIKLVAGKTYTLEVSHAGFKTQVKQYTLKPGENHKNISLVRKLIGENETKPAATTSNNKLFFAKEFSKSSDAKNYKSDSLEVRVDSGYLVFNTDSDDKWKGWRWWFPAIDESKDYSIEVKFHKKEKNWSKGLNFAYGFSFGEKKETKPNTMYFYISGSGKYSFRRRLAEVFSNEIPFESSKAVNRDFKFLSWAAPINILKLVKERELLHLYINGERVNTVEYKKLGGEKQQFHISAANKQKILVDYIRIKYED